MHDTTTHDCDTLLGQLSLCLDNLLPEEDCARIHAELAQCPTCQAFYGAMLRIDQTLRATPMKAPRYNMSTPVLALIDQREKRQKRALGFTLLLSGAMSLVPTLVVVLGLVIAFWTSSNPGILQNGVDIAISLANTIQALLFAISTLGSAIAPWIPPTFAALVSVLLLFLTVVWARRIVPAPNPVRI
jgi:predicted anti-sigma-YlaC factor YlaD